MIVDVTIRHDGQNLFVDSRAATYSRTMPAKIALSRHWKEEINEAEFIEFFGQNVTVAEMQHDTWYQNRDKGSRIYRVINPFLTQTFEPIPAAKFVWLLCHIAFSNIKPSRGDWRLKFGFDRFELLLKLPNYQFISSEKRTAFEKALRRTTKLFKIESTAP